MINTSYYFQMQNKTKIATNNNYDKAAHGSKVGSIANGGKGSKTRFGIVG